MIKDQLIALMLSAGLIASPAPAIEKTPIGFVAKPIPTATAAAKYDPIKMAGIKPQGFIDAMLGIPLGVCSSGISTAITLIQVGSIQFNSGTGTTATASISAVNTTYASVHFLGRGGSNNSSTNYPQDCPRLSITSSTQVTCNTNTAYASDTGEVGFCVIEWHPNAVQSVQRGTITLSAVTSNTATISSVNTANTIVLYGGESVTSNTSIATSCSYVDLASATTVRATRNTGTGTNTVSYSAVEFKSAALQSLQKVTVTISSGNTTGSTSISAVTMNKTWCAYGGFKSDQTSAGHRYWGYAYLASTTSVGGVRDTSTTNSPIHYVNVVEFKSNMIKTLTRNTVSISAAGPTTNTLSLSPNVTVSKTLASWLGSTSPFTTNLPHGCVIVTALSTSALTVKRWYTSSGSAGTASVEAVEFN